MEELILRAKMDIAQRGPIVVPASRARAAIAVRHGLVPRVREGSLVARAARDHGRTRIDVEDTGVGLPAGWRLHDATGTGLRNLASRLAAEFGDAAALHVDPPEGVASVRP